MDKKVYTHCIICKRELQDINPVTGETRPTMSAYPYCGSCAMKSLNNKGFSNWVKRKIRKAKKLKTCQE